MRASKKKKSKPVPPTGGGGGGGTPASNEPAAAASPLRVDPKLGKVRRQLQWVQMKKEYALRQQRGYRKEKTKFRKDKDDEPEYVEEVDLSKVHITKVLPTLLIDGYNIIMFWPKLKKKMEQGQTERARALLLEELGELSAMRGWSIKVIYDAYSTDSVTPTRTKVSKTIETVFTAKDQTADMYIERETQDLKRAGCPSVMVATGDSVIQTIAGAHGALVMSPAKVVQEMKIARKESVSISVHRVEQKKVIFGGGIAASRRIENCMDEATRQKMLRWRLGLDPHGTDETDTESEECEVT